MFEWPESVNHWNKVAAKISRSTVTAGYAMTSRFLASQNQHLLKRVLSQ